MRLIDAEDLYSRFEDEYKVSYKKAMATLSDYWRGIHDGIDWGCLRIIKAPTIEAEPVRHGEWVKNEKESEKHIEAIYYCSICQNWEAWGETEKTKYCPNCGAKIDGGKKDE